MLPFLLRPVGRPVSVVAIGAHCDDIEIGAGGLLMRLVETVPDVKLHCLVLSSTPRRAAEARASLAAWVTPVVPEVTIGTLVDSRLPASFDAVKDALAQAAARPADLVLCPHAGDAHQDHALLGRLVPTAFRDHVVLQYEIPKWDGDLGASRPQAYVPLDEWHVQRKWALLDEHYPSQRGHDWWTADTFGALARLRGIESRTQYAEAFRVDKLTLSF